MSKKLYYLGLVGLALALQSCKALARVIPVTDPVTGEVTETTVGDQLAETVVTMAEPASGILSNIVGTATANPVIGAGAGAALLAALTAGAAKLRRNK